MKLVYCKRCVMPSTKPDLVFDREGVCDACRSAENKSKIIDWEKRRKEFEKIIQRFRSKDGKNYDCLIPVSGGKDSHYQTYVIKKIYGLNPLLVSFEQTFITELGRKNLENIRRFGVDLIYFKKNPEVYKKMVIEGFKKVGDNEWPNHVGIFTVPVNLAVKLNIPLIIWGENPQLEYGGPTKIAGSSNLDRRWLERYGGLLGKQTKDMIGINGITKKDLLSYTYPSIEDLKRVGVTGLFLGYYFKWDARRQVEIDKKEGFSIKEDGPIEGTYTNYENLDDKTVGLHDYLKFVKYGFGRATDHACLDIRNGRLTREEAMDLVRKYDGKYPYYGVKNFSLYSGLTKEEIDKTIDRFTNKRIFKGDKNGNLIRDIAGNLIKINYDNE